MLPWLAAMNSGVRPNCSVPARQHLANAPCQIVLQYPSEIMLHSTSTVSKICSGHDLLYCSPYSGFDGSQKLVCKTPREQETHPVSPSTPAHLPFSSPAPYPSPPCSPPPPAAPALPPCCQTAQRRTEACVHPAARAPSSAPIAHTLRHVFATASVHARSLLGFSALSLLFNCIPG